MTLTTASPRAWDSIPAATFDFREDGRCASRAVRRLRRDLYEETRRYEVSADIMQLRNRLSVPTRQCYKYPHGLVLCKEGFRCGFAAGGNPNNICHKPLRPSRLPYIQTSRQEQEVLEDIKSATRNYILHNMSYLTTNRRGLLKLRLKVLMYRIHDALFPNRSN